jgi:hypothetical protein
MYAVTGEVWPIAMWERDRKLSRSLGILYVGEKKAAEEYAERRASEFDSHGHQGEPRRPYWWGRRKDDRENHRFIIQPVCLPR